MPTSVNTPSKPSISFKSHAKTPFQASSFNQRGSRSEVQPNRPSGRIAPDSFRCPQTSQRSRLDSDYKPPDPETLKCPQTVQRPRPATAVSSIVSRLNIFTKNNEHNQKKLDPNRRTPAPIRHDNHHQQQKDLLHKSNISIPENNLFTQINTKAQLQLVRDTRGPNQQVAPPVTATKAPLSVVSQYTQPTPGPNNKPAYQFPRAQSEPSIKYQVKVNDKTYKVLKKIGSGGSAKVYEGFEPSTYQSVAIKIINVAKADPRTQEGYFNEKSILMKLQDSKHVVKIFNSEYKAECKELVIVMEKGDADLAQVIESHSSGRDGIIDGIFIKFYWRGMLQAVRDIHEHGIIHADLKPVNFILVKNVIKLIDFGIASAVDPDVTSIVRDYQIGTINYMAPEALRNRATDASFIQLSGGNKDENNDHKRTVIKYDSKVDIWSLGCILYNLVYGRPPFDGYKDIVSKLHAITDPRHVIQFPELNNAHLMRCMKSCLRYNPKERPSAKQLLEDPYLKDDIIHWRKN